MVIMDENGARSECWERCLEPNRETAGKCLWVRRWVWSQPIDRLHGLLWSKRVSLFWCIHECRGSKTNDKQTVVECCSRLTSRGVPASIPATGWRRPPDSTKSVWLLHAVAGLIGESEGTQRPSSTISWYDIYIFIHTYTYIYTTLKIIYIYIAIELHHDFLPLAICSGIRIFFVVFFIFISSEFRQTFRFCHKFFRQNFVRISSELELKQRNFWRNFDDFFLWQNVVAKRFAARKISSKPCRVLTNFSLWQNVLPQHFATKKNRQNFVKQFVQISSNLSWSNRNLWRNFNEIFTIIFCGKRCGKMDCHKDCHEIFNESFNELSTTDWRYIHSYCKSWATPTQ